MAETAEAAPAETTATVQELFLDPKTHRVLGVSRLIDEGLMMDVSSPYAVTQGASSGAGTLLTLSLRK